MAYRITYVWNKERELSQKGRGSVLLLPGMLLVGAAAAARILFPETFRELLHPLTDETAVAAFAEFVGQVGEGISIADAVTAFCREVLGNA